MSLIKKNLSVVINWYLFHFWQDACLFFFFYLQEQNVTAFTIRNKYPSLQVPCFATSESRQTELCSVSYRLRPSRQPQYILRATILDSVSEQIRKYRITFILRTITFFLTDGETKHINFTELPDVKALFKMEPSRLPLTQPWKYLSPKTQIAAFAYKQYGKFPHHTIQVAM